MSRAWVICLVSALASAQPADPDTEAAKRHFDRGKALYEQQRYDEALGEFETARALKPLPELLYNIGRTQERREEWAAAANALASGRISPPHFPTCAGSIR